MRGLGLHFEVDVQPCVSPQARRKETFIQERYACFTLTDPFLALQRDGQPGGGDKEGRNLGASPVSVLEAVMAHCRKMQERMSAQLAAAESRQKKVGFALPIQPFPRQLLIEDLCAS